MLGDRRDSCSLCPYSWGAGGARISLHTELIPSLLSSEGAFSGNVDSLGQENIFWGQAPRPPDLYSIPRKLIY